MLKADLDPDEWPDATDAAVLVAVTDRPTTADGPGLILTRRNGRMRTHAGQVAFPGGRIDANESAIEAALREAEEEIALPRATPRIVGTMDDYVTGTGYHVTPVLAVIPPDLDFSANPAEVDHWFEVPLSVIADPARRSEEQAEYKGRTRSYWRIHYRDYDIWGATAAMIVNLARRLSSQDFYASR